jgi:DNA relaxase NicK
MSLWTCVIGWFRFTVPDATVEDIMSLIEGDWIKDQKGFQGYAQAWLSRGNSGGLGRIGTGAKRNPREVHVDLSQELISGWTYEQFNQVASWVIEKQGHFGRIDVALDDRSGLIDIDRIYASVVAGNCVSHFRQSRLISGLDLGSGIDTGKTICLGSRQSDT